MPKPTLVIVGRPNVGKSTLFNRIVGKRAAIVEDVPGVTRDRNYMDAAWEGKGFVAVDTGGFFTEHDDNIFTQIKEQALFAIDEADVIIHVLDAKDGLNPHDRDLAQLLRQSGKSVIWVANKVDSEKREESAYGFYELGIDEVMPISATTGYNYTELIDKVASLLPEYEDEYEEYPRVAIVGRPNVGKSTLINSILGKKKLLVSPIAGTTRDAIDTVCSYYKRKYTLIDTAGIHRKARHGYTIERFAMMRALKAIERCDVALIVIDASEGIVAEDQKIAGLVHEAGKSAIFVFNKWDLVTDHEKRLKELQTAIGRKMFFFSHAQVITTSGLEKKRITKLFPMIDDAMIERNKRIKTADLNRVDLGLNLPSHKGRNVKIYYLTQYASNPPAFTLFTNMPDAIKEHNIKHIESRLRALFSFAGSPIFIKVRKRG